MVVGSSTCIHKDISISIGQHESFRIYIYIKVSFCSSSYSNNDAQWFHTNWPNDNSTTHYDIIVNPKKK